MASLETSRASRTQASRVEVAARWRARVGHAPVLLAGRKTTGRLVVGWAAGGPAQELGRLLAPGKSFSPSLLIVFVFLFFCNFRALLKILQQIQKS